MVIFTRYTITVVFFLLHLRRAGFKTLSYTTNTLPYCDNNIKEFENIDGPVVLLVDFQSSRRHQFTVNAACRVFLLDACRKSIEEELVACVTQPLCVLRLISQNTIEDKILSLKETFSQTDTFWFLWQGDPEIHIARRIYVMMFYNQQRITGRWIFIFFVIYALFD
jgi:hypothetical protein